MSWIPISTTLRDSPEVLRISKITGLNRYEVIGCIITIWCYGDNHADLEGRLKWHGVDEVARIIEGKRKIVEAMVLVDWLTFEGEDAILPNWTKWNAKSSKARISHARRVSMLRAKAKVQPINTPTESQKTQEGSQIALKLDSIAEETKPTVKRPVSVEFTDEFNTFWAYYPRHTSKKAAESSFRRFMLEKKVPLEFILEKIEEQKKTLQWQNPTLVPHPSTWLNQRRWEDVIPEPIHGNRKQATPAKW